MATSTRRNREVTQPRTAPDDAPADTSGEEMGSAPAVEETDTVPAAPVEETDTVPADAPAESAGEDDLEIEEAEWGKGSSRPVHPQLKAKLEHSWANRVVNGNHIQTPAYKIPIKSAEDLKLRTRQLRDAGNALKIGVSLRPEIDEKTGAGYLHFRARKRRGSGEVTQ